MMQFCELILLDKSPKDVLVGLGGVLLGFIFFFTFSTLVPGGVDKKKSIWDTEKKKISRCLLYTF